MQATDSYEPAGGGITEMDRRAFLRASAAGLALGMLGLRSDGAQAFGDAGRIRYVVTDKRHPQSLAFGRALVAEGATPLEVTDGLTRLWRDVLAQHWTRGSGAVVGMTLPGTWTALSEQARIQWRRPCVVGRHLTDSKTGKVAHRLVSPLDAPGVAAAIEQQGRDWPVAMALLARHTADSARPGARLSVAEQQIAPTPDALLTWRIA